MHFQHMILAMQANETVNSQLRIESSNRPGDDKPDDFMKPLEDKKAKSFTKAYDRRAALVGPLEIALGVLDARAMALRQHQIKIGMAASKLEADERKEIMSVLPNIGKTLSSVQEQARQVRKQLEEMREMSDEERSLIIAKSAMKTSRGNCDEMSCIAYYFLRARGLRPLDLLSTAENAEFDQHQFVVIGRANDDPLASPGDWSEDAVVCDPWMNAVYETGRLPARLREAGYPETGYSIVMRDE